MDIPRGEGNNVARKTAVNPRAHSCKGMPRNAMISMAAVPASVSSGTNADERMVDGIGRQKR